MKKLAVIFIFLSLSFKTNEPNEPKKLTFTFTEEEVNYHYNNLTNAQLLVDKSNMNHQDVVFIIKSIDSLKNVLSKQYREQKKN